MPPLPPIFIKNPLQAKRLQEYIFCNEEVSQQFMPFCSFFGRLVFASTTMQPWTDRVLFGKGLLHRREARISGLSLDSLCELTNSLCISESRQWCLHRSVYFLLPIVKLQHLIKKSGLQRELKFLFI
uniref:Uncharacterized protein n=1 Tax=Micrurus corallinus TaxID=54390 RepID=A0A2D4GGW6_MICCO